MQAEPQVVREGWLVKKGPSPNNTWRFWDTTWKRRYFVLCSGQLPGESRLIWYQDDQHRRSGKSKGTINLQDCEQVDSYLSLSYERRNKRISYPWVFDIRVNTAKGSHLYYFNAASEQDMNEWVRVLCHVCHLEREDDSDMSTGNERFSAAATTAHRAERDAPSVPSTAEHRYVEQPGPAILPSSSSPGLQKQSNGRGPSQPVPTLPNRLANSSQLSVVPPAPFIARPAAPPPVEPSTAPVGEEGKNPSTSLSKNTLGYIPLNECISDPVAVEDTSSRSRLGATSDQDASFFDVSSPIDTVIADQPPSFPAPPLPGDDNVFQIAPNASTSQNEHSRTPSKDSSVSSVHLSSTESEPGDNRRPSVGNGVSSGSATGAAAWTPPSTGAGVASGPTSPISPPAAVTYNRLPRSSNGSSAQFTSDDTPIAMTPPPRPPKKPPSTSSQQQLAYENEPTANQSEEGSKFTSYDQLTFVQRQVINFDSLPRTKTQIAAGRRSQESPLAFHSISKYSTTEKGLSDGPDAASAQSFDNDVVAPAGKDPRPLAPSSSIHNLDINEPRLRNDSLSSVLTEDTDSSYSPFTPGPPRLAPLPTSARPSRSPSDKDATGGPNDQYQNFMHPPRVAGLGQRSPISGSNVSLDKPPEVKRELKPGPRIRSPTASSSGGGIGPLPKVPNRLTDIRKGTGNASAGGGNIYYSHGVSDQSTDPHMPQFNIERQVSFKSQKRIMGRQQPATGLMPGVKGSGRNDILDAEVKVESEAQLEYVFVDTPAGRVMNTPPGTPSSFPRRYNSGGPSAHSPAPSFSMASYTEHVSSVTVVTSAPGYVQIDPQATGALRLAQAESAAWRDSQHRTLERNKSLQSQQTSTSGLLGNRKK